MKRPWFIKMFPGSASNWEGTESAGLAGRREVERHSLIGKERGLEGVGSLFESVGLVSQTRPAGQTTVGGGRAFAPRGVPGNFSTWPPVARWCSEEETVALYSIAGAALCFPCCGCGLNIFTKTGHPTGTVDGQVTTVFFL